MLHSHTSVLIYEWMALTRLFFEIFGSQGWVPGALNTRPGCILVVYLRLLRFVAAKHQGVTLFSRLGLEIHASR